MALNFLGLGFNFGSQDKGLADSIKTTSSGIGDISKGILQASAASAKMAFKPPNFGPALASAQNLASDMKLTTTSIEAFGVASNKTTSAGLAGLNLTSKQLKKAQGEIAGGSLAMNIGAENMTKSFVALTQAGVDIKKVGFTGGLKEFQKFVEVTGVDATKFAGTLGRLTNQMGFQEDEAGNLVKATAAIGKKFNIGREAVQGMSDTVAMLNENSNLLPQNWSKERTAEFVKGATKFAGALTSVGLTADEAMAASQGLTKALLQGETGLANLYSGVNDKMPDIATAMTKHLGNAQDAFKSLQDDPASFAANLGGLVDEVRGMNLKPEALNMFMADMQKQFGPGAMAVFTKKGIGKIGPAMAEASKPIAGQEKILQSLAKQYKDGRTYADRFALAQDRLVTRMKKIDGVMSDQEYLKKYRKNTDKLYNSLNATAKKGGPIGKMTTMLIEMRTKGIGGALASHSKYGMALAELSNQFAPIITALPGLAAGFAALANPVTLVAAAVGGLYFAFKDLEKGDQSIIRPWLKSLKKKLPELIAKVKEVFTKALSMIGKVITYVVANIPWQKVGEVLGQVLVYAGQAALFLFEQSLKVGEKILGAITSINWNGVGKKLGSFLVQAVEIGLKYLGKLIQKLPSMVVKFANMAVSMITGVLDGIGDYLANKFPEYAKPIMFVFIMLKTAVKAYFEVFKMVWGAIAGIIKGVWNVLSDGLEMIGDAGNAVIDFFSSSEKVATQSAASAVTARLKAKEAEAKRHQQFLDFQSGKIKSLKGYVKTQEGVAIKSADAIVQYVKSETGEIKAMIMEANKMSLADISFEPAKKAAELWSEYKKANDAVTGHSEKAHKKRNALYADYTKKRHAYESEHGVDLHRTQQMNNLISKQMAVQKDVLKGVAGASMSYTASIKANQTAYANAMAKEAQVINQRLQAGDISLEQAKVMETAMLKKAASFRELSKQTGDIIDQNFSKVVKAAKREGESLELMSERVAHVYAENFKANTDDILAKLPEKMGGLRDEFKSAFDDIARANKVSNMEILADTKTSASMKQKLVRENNKIYLEQQGQLAAGLEKYNDQIVGGSEDGIRKVLTGITQGMSTIVADTKVKGAEAAAEIQKTIGVSADKAADMVGQISNIKPKKFRNNMRIIKKEFTAFLKKTVSESKLMMDLSAKYINAYWKSSEEGWKNQTNLVQAWSLTAEQAIQKYWSVTITEAGRAAMGFVGLVVKMQAKMTSLAKSINLMDMLASPTQIDRWASSVVSALAVSFKGGKAADAMIGAAYNKAIAMSAVIETASATPDGGSSSSGSSLAQHASNSLKSAIDHPAWAEEKGLIPSQLKEMNETLRAVASTLSQPEESSKSKGKTSRGKRKATR